MWSWNCMSADSAHRSVECKWPGSKTNVTFLLLSDALSTVKLQQSTTVTSLLDQANLDGLKFLVVFKTNQVSQCWNIHQSIFLEASLSGQGLIEFWRHMLPDARWKYSVPTVSLSFFSPALSFSSLFLTFLSLWLVMFIFHTLSVWLTESMCYVTPCSY